MTSTGSIFAQGVGVGPNNTEFTVDRTSGQVTFDIGTPTPVTPEVFPLLGSPAYSTVPSTGITAVTKNTDAVNILNNWLSTYLLDSPPVFTNVAGTKDTSKITITYTLPPQKKIAFTASTAPYIQRVMADIIPSAQNAGGLWTNNYATITLESPATNAFATVNTLQLFVQQGTSVQVGPVYQAMGFIATQIPYDVRVYGVNQSSQIVKYATVFNIATDAVGPPDAPTSFGASAIAQSLLTASWTAPADRDVNLAGVQNTPFISQYRVDRAASSSVRFGGAISDTVSLTTAATTSSDSATTLAVTILNPGTVYSMQVFAKNTINSLFGAGSNIILPQTLLPTATAFLAATDSNTLDATQLVTLRAPYLSSGGFNLEGVVAPIILNSTRLTNTNTYATYSGLKRTNFTPGDSSAIIGALSANGGPSSSFTIAANTATFNTAGFGTVFVNGSVASTSGSVAIVYQGDGDQYTTPVNNTGFYKVINSTVMATNVATAYAPASTPYSLSMQYSPNGGSLVVTNALQFFVDALNAASVIDNAQVTAETGSNTTQISGVPSFTSSAVFKTQFNQSNAAAFFVRNDRKHAEISMVNTSGATTLGATVSVLTTSIGATNKYFISPTTNKYTTSTTLVNTTGLQLPYTTTPADIQFNTFNVALTAASNTFDENLQVKVIPFSNFTNGGAAATGAYVNTSTGVASTLRIDQPSIAAKAVLSNAATATGQHCSSGAGVFPEKAAFTAYDHTVSLITTSDLQLLNGQFVTPSSASYKNYTTIYSGSSGLPTFDYTSITSSLTSFRYVTFKYTGIMTTGQSKLQFTVVQTGMTLGANLSSANHSFQVMVDDSTNGAFTSTGLMDACSPVLATGVGSGSNGTACGDIASTTAARKVYVPPGASTSAIVYVRIGVPCNISTTVTSVTAQAVSVFF